MENFLNYRDRIRTSINVMGDAFGAGIVAHLCREQLRIPAKRLNSISVSVPHTKWGDNQDDSPDELGDRRDQIDDGADDEIHPNEQHGISMELLESTKKQRA